MQLQDEVNTNIFPLSPVSQLCAHPDYQYKYLWGQIVVQITEIACVKTTPKSPYIYTFKYQTICFRNSTFEPKGLKREELIEISVMKHDWVGKKI